MRRRAGNDQLAIVELSRFERAIDDGSVASRPKLFALAVATAALVHDAAPARAQMADALGRPLPKSDLPTGTLTVRYSPVPQLVITLENRVEVASADIFSTRSGPGASDVHFATILGVSGHVGN